MSFSNLQAVTVKEALSTKARHLRRSLSTPNVHNVSSPARGCRPRDASQGLGCSKSGDLRSGFTGGDRTFGTSVGIPRCQARSSFLAKLPESPYGSRAWALSGILQISLHKVMSLKDVF